MGAKTPWRPRRAARRWRPGKATLDARELPGTAQQPATVRASLGGSRVPPTLNPDAADRQNVHRSHPRNVGAEYRIPPGTTRAMVKASRRRRVKTTVSHYNSCSRRSKPAVLVLAVELSRRAKSSSKAKGGAAIQRAVRQWSRDGVPAGRRSTDGKAWSRRNRPGLRDITWHWRWSSSRSR